jgi:hypothetical protein
MVRVMKGKEEQKIKEWARRSLLMIRRRRLLNSEGCPYVGLQKTPLDIPASKHSNSGMATTRIPFSCHSLFFASSSLRHYFIFPSPFTLLLRTTRPLYDDIHTTNAR